MVSTNDLDIPSPLNVYIISVVYIVLFANYFRIDSYQEALKRLNRFSKTGRNPQSASTDDADLGRGHRLKKRKTFHGEASDAEDFVSSQPPVILPLSSPSPPLSGRSSPYSSFISPNLSTQLQRNCIFSSLFSVFFLSFIVISYFFSTFRRRNFVKSRP